MYNDNKMARIAETEWYRTVSVRTSLIASEINRTLVSMLQYYWSPVYVQYFSRNRSCTDRIVRPEGGDRWIACLMNSHRMTQRIREDQLPARDDRRCYLWLEDDDYAAQTRAFLSLESTEFPTQTVLNLEARLRFLRNSKLIAYSCASQSVLSLNPMDKRVLPIRPTSVTKERDRYFVFQIEKSGPR